MVPSIIIILGMALVVKYCCNVYKKITSLKTQLKIYQESIQATPYAIAIYDENNILIDYNNAYYQIHYDAFSKNNKIVNYADLIRATADQFVPKNETEQWVAERVATQRNGDGSYVDRLYPDGRWLRVSKHKTPCQAVVGYGIDITQLKNRELELDDSKKRYSALTEITPTGIWQLSQNGETLFINNALKNILGLSQTQENILSNTPIILDCLHLYDGDTLLSPTETKALILKGKKEKHMEAEYIADVKKTLLIARSRLIEDKDGQHSYMLVINDTTDRKKAEQDIRYLAEHDSLTGLANRGMLNRHLNNLFKNNQNFALVLLDLDHFKDVNDSLGHQTGDLLLKEATKRIKNTLREQDFACRLGGDEFAITLPAIENMHNAHNIVARIYESFKPPVIIDNDILSISVSAGIALYPEHGNNAQEIIKNADIALYHQKNLGRGSFTLFETALASDIQHRKQLEQDLRRALNSQEELHVHYQPQYYLAEQTISGVEALVRWYNQRTNQWVSPADFIPIAEQSGLIYSLDKFVLTSAAKQVHAWHLMGYPNLMLASNLSTLHFRGDTLKTMINDVIKVSHINPARLELEITEGLFLEDQSCATQLLKEFRKQGIRIAVDDFGTGYSNLGYLNNLPVDCLKIDRSFIDNFEKDNYYRSIVKFIIELGLNLKLDIVAEGVETQAQLDALTRLNASHAQGFFLAKPQNAEAIEALLKDSIHKQRRHI